MNQEIITHADPKSPISEVFKTLRTNLQFIGNSNKNLSLLVTSTMPGEGKSWVTANLAVAFAQANKKVVMIDSDMRKGRLHNIFNLKVFPGLSNYLSENEKNIKEYVMKTEIENLYVIPAGSIPPNPSELLSNERMPKGLEELQKEFDIILFDSTPCMLVTDAVIISRIVDYTIIVSKHKGTKIENLKEIQKNIENVGGKIAGVIINRIPISLKKYKSKYYYYGNREESEIETIEKNSFEEISNTQREEKKEIANKEEAESVESKDKIMEEISKYLD